MTEIKPFEEFCPKHKAHVVCIMSKMPVFCENGDQLHEYKCPIPRCSFRTFMRVTKAQRERDQKVWAETLRSKFNTKEVKQSERKHHGKAD